MPCARLRRSTGVPLVLNARTDVYLLQVGDPAGRYDETVRRLMRLSRRRRRLRVRTRTSRPGYDQATRRRREVSAEYSRRAGFAVGAGTASSRSGASESWVRSDARRDGDSAAHRTGSEIQRDLRFAERCADARRNESAAEIERLRTSILIGVISDTHGLLRPEALEALRGSEHIIHAGDVGAPEILEQLATIAPR